ncbi:CpsB/CapC family capsule biosynthesis tyrosine phosphatase [Pseudogracilibacillus sp. SE30717A]|uniref:tyrosine-protein phosphatase n=1 Tax=Pseudogracilibacillus sp. SE30717A TaxID=3098293 RepID=UPI00300DCC26
MIDIHSHILPGIDDGAKTEQDSLDMAKAAIEQGVTKIVASPHHKNRTYDNYKDDILTHVSVLNDLFQANGVPLEVIAGQEVRIYGEVMEDLERGEILPVNDSKYLLIEFPSDSVPHYTEQLLYDIQLAGIKPVIVHPERNRELLQNHRRMYELVRNGALTQVTAASVVGKFGKQIEEFTHQLIEANLAHFIASDAHNTTTRGFCMQEAFEFVKKQYGVETYYMFVENGHLLVENMNVNRVEPTQIQTKRRKLFGLF